MARRIGQNLTFQDDYARPHRAHVAVDFLRQQGVTTFQWPAKSIDLSPIEHLCDVLGRRVCARRPAPANLQELGVALQDAWQQIPRAMICRVISSMPGRFPVCVAPGGGYTRY